MRDGELPTYDHTEQGVADDHETIQEASVTHQRRIERNRDVRNQLIQQLNTGTIALTAPPRIRATPASAPQPTSRAPRAALYLRVSTEEQARKGGEAEGYSLPTQRDACRLKAQELGAIVTEEYVEAGDSARSANRPELQRLLRDVRQKRFDYVIVHKIDRWARWKEDDVLLTAAPPSPASAPNSSRPASTLTTLRVAASTATSWPTSPSTTPTTCQWKSSRA